MTEPTPGILKVAEAMNAPAIKADTPHYEAMGRFVTTFATAEAAVHMLARKLSGLSDAKARIVFGGMRLPDLIDIIRQMARIDGVEEDVYSNIDGCLTQLNHIGTRRHSLVHRTTNVFDGKLVVTNVLTSKAVRSSQTEVFEISEMAAMESDCGRIFLKLNRVVTPKHALEDPPGYAEFLLLPWRYKHEPPKTPNLKPRAKQEARKLPPLSSLGKLLDPEQK